MGQSTLLKKDKLMSASNFDTTLRRTENESSSMGNQAFLRAAEASKKVRPETGTSIELPDQIKAKMEAHFGYDLSGIKFKESPEVSQMGAKAFAQGNVVKFAPGKFNPDTMSGRQMIGHEIAHVVQQAKGGINSNIEGSAVNYSESFENMADMEGAKAAMAADSAYNAPSSANLAPLPAVDAANAPIQGLFDGIRNYFAERARKKEEKRQREQMLEQLKDRAKNNGEAYTKEEADIIKQKFEGNKEQKQYELEALSGDFRNFAKMKPELKHLLASRFISGKDTVKGQAINQIIGDDPENGDPDQLAGQLVESGQALNPLLRKSLSMMSRTNSDDAEEQRKAAFYQQLNDSLDTKEIEQTLMPLSQAQRESVQAHYGSGEHTRRNERELSQLNFVEKMMRSKHEPGTADEAISQNNASSLSMMKVLLAMQMGNFQYAEKDQHGNKVQRNWDKSMAVALSRGARVGFVLPSAMEGDVGSQALFDSIYGANRDESGMHQRTAATHGLKRADANDATNNSYKEKHGMKAGAASIFGGLFSKIAGIFGKNPNITKHYGMDLAVGGMGNKGIGGENGEGQRIMKDGRSGHLYVGTVGGDASKKGGMLVGLESDAPYRSNQTGHMHTAKAIGEEASSTGGYKTDLVGEKYGGRTVDLSGNTNEHLVNVMNTFDQYARGKMSSGTNEDRAEMAQIIHMLAGKKLNEEQLAALMARIGMNNG